MAYHFTESGGVADPAPEAAVLIGHVKSSLQDALAERSGLDPAVLTIPGMSGRKYRHFVNNLIRRVPQPRYLEVGSWQGSTLCAAISGNQLAAVAIDNWSMFGGPKAAFMQNLARHKGMSDVRFIESDFRAVAYDQLGPFNVYLFDGPHKKADHQDGITVAQPALEPHHVVIVDDWNWQDVRQGTRQGLAASGLKIDYAFEIRTTLDNTLPEVKHQHSEWHNGYFVAAVSR